MNTLLKTDVFDVWLNGLKDRTGKALILRRIEQAEAGNFGDCEPVGEGISEIRVHFGPGYRLYHPRHGEVTYLLLGGGVKSTQKRDIKAAIALKNALNKD